MSFERSFRYFQNRRGLVFQCLVELVLLAALGATVYQKLSYDTTVNIIFTIIVGSALLALNPMRILILPKHLKVAGEEAVGNKKSYAFYEGGVATETDGAAGSSWSYTGYSAIVGVYEAKKVFYLYTSSRQTMIVSKDGIELGSADELRALLLRNIPKERYFTGWL